MLYAPDKPPVKAGVRKDSGALLPVDVQDFGGRDIHCEGQGDKPASRSSGHEVEVACDLNVRCLFDEAQYRGTVRPHDTPTIQAQDAERAILRMAVHLGCSFPRPLSPRACSELRKRALRSP